MDPLPLAKAYIVNNLIVIPDPGLLCKSRAGRSALAIREFIVLIKKANDSFKITSSKHMCGLAEYSFQTL
jgi:hypothetical protein